jgi:hypothetical protein
MRGNCGLRKAVKVIGRRLLEGDGEGHASIARFVGLRIKIEY